MKPTGVQKTATGIALDGYPDAIQIVVFPTKIGQRLAALRLHQSTLTFCETAMQRLGALRKADVVTSEAVLTGVVARYYSCFGRNEAGYSLPAARVFKAMPDAKECFDHWKALRDKTLVHNESRLVGSKSAIVLGKKGEVQDVVSLIVSLPLSTDDEHLQLLYNLISHTLKYVAAEIETLLPKAFAQARGMKEAERIALPPLTFEKPIPDNAAIVRSWK